MTKPGPVKTAITAAIEAIEATGSIVNVSVEVNSLDRYVIELEVIPPKPVARMPWPHPKADRLDLLS